MDKPITKQTKRRAQSQTVLRWLLIVGGFVTLLLVVRNLLKTKVEAETFQFAKIERGTIENTITASGMVVPLFEQQIVSPIRTAIKEVLKPSGTTVKEGEAILLLDDEFVRLEYESLRDQLELKNNNLTRLKYEYDKNIKELDYNNQIKGLELARLESQLADAERLLKIGSATQEEVEQAQLQLGIAKLEKKKLENNLTFSQQVLPGDRRNLELETLIEKKKLQEFQRKLRETKVSAPREGVITWINEDIGKTVSQGELIVRLADLGRFRIEASCSDRYAQYVKVGQSVRVRINRKDLTGIVTTILPAVENNTNSLNVEQTQPDSPLLRPNMRVEVFLISNKREQALRLRNGPVFTGAANQNLFVVRGQEAVRVTTRVGLTGIDLVELLDTDLQEGDQVIISDMRDYDHLDRIQLQ